MLGPLPAATPTPAPASPYDSVILSPAEFAALFERITGNVEKVIHGKHDEIELAVTCLLAEGHLLLEDLPGMGKTRLARGLAASLGLRFGRIQFTPDLLPADITGMEIYNRRTREFDFRPGPLSANIVLADEINRASPKTQSALLEAMEEGQVTVGGTTRTLPRPFTVLATQNPVDMGGTYPLPEAQLDRFLMRLRLGYPSFDAEIAVLRDHHAQVDVSDLQPAVTSAELAALGQSGNQVHVSDRIFRYITALVAATRTSPLLDLGASPRASVALLRVSKVRAASRGRAETEPDDVQVLAGPVLAHRLLPSPRAEEKGMEAEGVVASILETITVQHF